MARPRRPRRILENPEIRCFKPDTENTDSLKPITITIDEFEAVRLKDYHDIQQKRSAELMEISQPTFHRTLHSARKKISKALIEGRPLIIVGDDPIASKIRYQCNNCDFEWLTPEKKYKQCPDCKSDDIKIVKAESMQEHKEGTKIEETSLLQRRSYGGPGLGAGPPKVCKCPNCGYEHPKTRAVPCRNTKCPKCETPLCGSNSR